MKQKINVYVIATCLLCFICGVFAGYLFAVSGKNNAYSADSVYACPDGGTPDYYGCCPGEIYTNMGDLGFNCCPEGNGDCYPPIR